MDRDEQWMKEALKEAALAEEAGEVPIGAVIVRDDAVIGRGRNRRETLQQADAHAEMAAVREACTSIGSWRLEGCTLYVTLEPCPMCAGAVIQSRIERVVFGAWDPKGGCCGSIVNLLEEDRFNHRADSRGGVLEEETGGVLTDFFRSLRQKRKEEKRRETESVFTRNGPDDVGETEHAD
ncbi:tRNA adenosine(34) deaminase TadA [Alkalicoccus chagannorensis]|uniref:tRNA adenosine(34) deaminase TadA n=1 Tax=Alkalicoccus chagannorensis TaxID=427072 RepID=UPI0006889AA3|nr:tRNA adenosine(34) deaminase TadA [Alkalicoccus chagannorensis]